ncbi:MAG: hypothetical protein JXA82_13875 [Sedimentisphaerales bacterium]|nr:hypothetical protein [Sedimentisphaerales bacterium]
MDTERIRDELLELLNEQGITVRFEAMGGGGDGLCTLKDRQVFFVDTQSSLLETAIATAQAVARNVPVDSIYLRPQVREFIEKYSRDTGDM